jgi:hypothetical protein
LLVPYSVILGRKLERKEEDCPVEGKWKNESLRRRAELSGSATAPL